MNQAIKNLTEAQKYAMSIRPKVGGFPVLAECLRQAGITRNVWTLPACQSIYHTTLGIVVQQGQPLINETSEIPKFNQETLIKALRTDQAGESTFPQFLKSSWESGVIGYDVDFEKRTCTYFGANGESYIEKYPAVEVKK